jgi:uncharacterized delta-60 repeat protein
LGIQSDGKIVVAGGIGDPSWRAEGALFQEDFFVARVNSDGSVDTGWGNAGQVRTSFAAGGQDTASDLAIQADGKIVVAGGAGHAFIGCDEGYPGAPDFALARYNTDGSLDTSFGAGGQVITSFTDYDWATTLSIQTDGKILVAGGTLRFLGLADFALARYTSDGSLAVSELRFEPSTVVPGDSFTALFSGPDLTGGPLFDVRFRRPGSDVDEVALNWQLGASAQHILPHDSPYGIWTVTGVRAHRNIDDQTRFLPIRAGLVVTPPK